MIKKGLLVLLMLVSALSYAETIHTDVLVIGGTESGTAAAIQSARSKLKTLLIEPQSLLGGQIIIGKGVITGNKDLPSGIWGEFRKHVIQYYRHNKNYGPAPDSSLRFEPYTGGAFLKKMADTVKNLTIKFNTSYTSIRQDGTGWEVNLKQGEEKIIVKARVLVDATTTSAAAKDVLKSTPLEGLEKLTVTDVESPYDQKLNLYRTAIAICDVQNGTPFSIPLGALVVKNADNLIVTGNGVSVDDTLKQVLQNPAVQLCIGQGAGTIAAYCAFFKTTTKNFTVKSVRAIQGELLDFKGYLLPFSDFPASDPNIRAIQQIGATGLIKGVLGIDRRFKEKKMLFMPDTLVRTAEIQPVLTDMYTRAFLWFNKNTPGTYFTTADLLSFISEISLRDPKTFRMDMEKQWQTVYKFKNTFDLQKPVNRREFAVLANKFLNPFARYVDITGKLIN
ncbi:FAD-dependent oxidoreductase [Mucilaginibacter ginkgonis]|uniref:FAD-dependent oxidoreductase n=1 Tax=Mucilaginibacter ginkgonis TaxID=2682091 RepID=A0A6I4HZH7_9SPHI|nr:FAD-dependent oxidoreductase [Mucilaginibacter ginkgonis]QQL48838.1 FAD-dependent oxidoreductase [Mucilaginibacter ginkgonis]